MYNIHKRNLFLEMKAVCIILNFYYRNPGTDLPFFAAFLNLFCFLSFFRFLILSFLFCCLAVFRFSSPSTRDSHFFFELFFFWSILLEQHRHYSHPLELRRRPDKDCGWVRLFCQSCISTGRVPSKRLKYHAVLLKWGHFWQQNKAFSGISLLPTLHVLNTFSSISIKM